MSAVSTGHIPSAMAASLRRIASLASRCPKLASAWLQSKSAEPRQEVEGRADSPITAAGAEAEAEGRAAPATAEAEVEGRADSPTAAEAEEEGRAALPTGAEAGVACAAPAAASAEEASSSAEMEVSATSAASISSTGGSASCDGGGGGGGKGGKRQTQKEVGQETESFAVKEREGREAGGAGKRRREARP